MVQTRKFKEIAETSARNQKKKSQYTSTSLENNKRSLFTLRFSVFVRLDFSLPEISIRVYQHIQFTFYSSGDRSSWFLAPLPSPQKRAM